MYFSIVRDSAAKLPNEILAWMETGNNVHMNKYI